MTTERDEDDEVEDKEFEAFIHDLVWRESATDKDSAEYRMIIRQLQLVKKLNSAASFSKTTG